MLPWFSFFLDFTISVSQSFWELSLKNSLSTWVWVYRRQGFYWPCVSYINILRDMKNSYLESHWVRYFSSAVYTTNELVTWLVNEYDTFPYELFRNNRNIGIEKTLISQIC